MKRTILTSLTLLVLVGTLDQKSFSHDLGPISGNSPAASPVSFDFNCLFTTRWDYVVTQNGQLGFFQRTNGQTWIEASGGQAYTFQETGRTADYVQLYDATRQLIVRLTNDNRALFIGGDGQWYTIAGIQLVSHN